MLVTYEGHQCFERVAHHAHVRDGETGGVHVLEDQHHGAGLQGAEKVRRVAISTPNDASRLVDRWHAEEALEHDHERRQPLRHVLAGRVESS